MILANIASADTLIVVLIIVVVMFGGAAIPKLARNLGSAKSEFEKGLKTEKDNKEKAAAVASDETKTPDASSS